MKQPPERGQLTQRMSFFTAKSLSGQEEPALRRGWCVRSDDVLIEGGQIYKMVWLVVTLEKYCLLARVNTMLQWSF